MSDKISEQKDKKQFYALLFKAADQLRGSLDAAEFKNVVLPIFFLKYVGDRFNKAYQKIKIKDPGFEEDQDAYKSEKILFVPSGARWNNICNCKNEEKIKDELDKAFSLITKSNRKWLQGVFDNNFFSKTMADKVSGYVLIRLVEIFENKLKTTENWGGDIFGEIYEYFLEKFASSSGKKSGEFYTPKSVVELLVKLIEPKKGRVYDPCCGSGGMFLHSNNFVKKCYGNGKSIDNQKSGIVVYGQEKNINTWRICKMNLAINQISNENLGSGPFCTFQNDQHTKYDHQMDYILANPPFNLNDYWHPKLENDYRWKYGQPPKGRANFAWIQHMITKLKIGGKAAFLLTLNSLDSQNREKEIRKKIVDDNLVDCIIELPDKLFYSTTINVCLWIIKKNRQRQKILLIDATKLGL